MLRTMVWALAGLLFGAGGGEEGRCGTFSNVCRGCRYGRRRAHRRGARLCRSSQRYSSGSS
jgi:hypothetical protein